MRRIWMGVALLLMAHGAFAAVQYEFIQTSRSDSDNIPAKDFSARGLIDGSLSRVDFISGNAYPPGAYVICNDGTHKVFYVDPTQKSYTELNTLAIASAIGTSNIVISNFVPTVTRLDDSRMIAGLPADHYRLTMNYNITVTFKNIPLKQSVRTVIDKWTTALFGDIAASSFAGSIMQTGNAKIDEVINAEMTKIKGFPLKQTIQVTTLNAGPNKPIPGSKLSIPATRTRTREMTVTSIQETKPDQSVFIVPVDYRRTEFAEQAPKSQMQVLSLEPSSK